MNSTDLRIKLAQARSEFDHLAWRKKRLDERLDLLAKEMDDLAIEVEVAGMIETAHTLPEVVSQAPLKMEIL